MAYYLGLDAGGTKTYCIVADQTGAILGFGRAGTGNYEYKGVQHAAAENRKAVETALARAGIAIQDLSRVGLGVAGADLPEDFVMLEKEMYTPLFAHLPRVFRNDSFAGLRGGTRSDFGIVIACGTGCVCAGRNRNADETRVGGLGEEFGDECTGESIGRAGLRAVWQSRDNIIGRTLLTERFVERSRCADVEELFSKMYHQEITYDDLAPMATVVFDAAVDADDKACDILVGGGEYLGAMVNAVARRLKMTETPFEVVYTGSVFKGSSPLLIESMERVIHWICPQATLVPPLYEPVVGALLLGMEGDVPLDNEFYGNLDASLAEAERDFDVRLKNPLGV